MNRRQLLCTTGLGLVGGAMAQARVLPASSSDAKSQPNELSLADYEPKSMLQVRETEVKRARYPVVDIHTHISISAKSKDGVELVPERQYLGTPEELLAVMDRKNIRSMVNLTGGYDAGLSETIRRYDSKFQDRFYTFTEPSYSLFLNPDYPKLQAQAIEAAHRAGARGLKILKTLGLYFKGECHFRDIGEDRRPAVRSDVGCLRAVEYARRDSRFRSGCLLHAY